MSENMVERVALAIKPVVERWCGPISPTGLRDITCAAIEAHKAALAKAGLVIVPREPTEAMLYAGNRLIVRAGTESASWTDQMPEPEDAWRAMIEAALTLTTAANPG